MNQTSSATNAAVRAPGAKRPSTLAYATMWLWRSAGRRAAVTSLAAEQG